MRVISRESGEERREGFDLRKSHSLTLNQEVKEVNTRQVSRTKLSLFYCRSRLLLKQAQ